ncbi:unnamed protein product, partial [marine sediment metagenome]
TADFSTFGDEGFEQDTFDIVLGTWGQASQPDGDGDSTVMLWRMPKPLLNVMLNRDSVHGEEWPPGAEVTLTIDDPATGGSPDYTDIQTVTTEAPGYGYPWGYTWVDFDLDGVFDVEPGHTVVLTDGVTTKGHIVSNLAATTIDVDADVVSGTANPGADVYVMAGLFALAFRHQVADGGGNWTADFSTPGDEPDEEETFDIVPGDGSFLQHEEDADGDYTYGNWYVFNTLIMVLPINNWVLAFHWPSGAEVTLTID